MTRGCRIDVLIIDDFLIVGVGSDADSISWLFAVEGLIEVRERGASLGGRAHPHGRNRPPQSGHATRPTSRSNSTTTES